MCNWHVETVFVSWSFHNKYVLYASLRHPIQFHRMFHKLKRFPWNWTCNHKLKDLINLWKILDMDRMWSCHVLYTCYAFCLLVGRIVLSSKLCFCHTQAIAELRRRTGWHKLLCVLPEMKVLNCIFSIVSIKNMHLMLLD